MRRSLSKQLVREISGGLGEVACELLKGAIEVVELGRGEEIIVVDGEALFLRSGGTVSPVLKALDRIPLKRVVVDMGAVPHVANGADIMAPGVVSADENITPGMGVVVIDERHLKPLAVGKALVPGTAMRGPRGKVVENLHHVGDEIWSFEFRAKG